MAVLSHQAQPKDEYFRPCAEDILCHFVDCLPHNFPMTEMRGVVSYFIIIYCPTTVCSSQCRQSYFRQLAVH